MNDKAADAFGRAPFDFYANKRKLFRTFANCDVMARELNMDAVQIACLPVCICCEWSVILSVMCVDYRIYCELPLQDTMKRPLNVEISSV